MYYKEGARKNIYGKSKKGKWDIKKRQTKPLVRERWEHRDEGTWWKKMMGHETMHLGSVSRCEWKVPTHTKQEMKEKFSKL